MLRIHSILEEIGVPWIAINSLALYLYGITDDFDSIWMLVSEDYHDKIDELFSQTFRLVEGMKYQETKYYISNISSYLTNSLPLNILSGLVIKLEDNIINPSFRTVLSSSKNISFYGARIFIPPLEWLFLYYLANPIKRNIAIDIVNKMAGEGINFNLLDTLLNNFPEEKRRDILEILEKT